MPLINNNKYKLEIIMKNLKLVRAVYLYISENKLHKTGYLL